MKQFNKVRITITLDPEVHEYIQSAAEKDDRTVSAMINKILKDYASEKEGQ